MTLTLRTDRSLIRADARSTRYLHVAFAAPVVPPRADRRPLSVAFVLDRSGSMGGAKIRLARQAVESAVRLLSPEDLFSIVVYDDRVDVLVAATQATPEARRLAMDRLAAIDARGSTDLHTGWLRGCEQVADRASADTIARCILLSDGLANHGMTDREVLATRAARLRSTHVVTSTLGVGTDFDERLMKAMASSGGGNFYYVERPRQIEDLLTSELSEALEIVARRARVDIDLPAGVDAELMHEFRAKLDGRRLRIHLEDLVSGQDVSLILKLRFPLGDPALRATLRAVVASEDPQLAGETAIAWTFADHSANDAQPRDRAVDRLVAEIYAARAHHDAVECNRIGDYDRAADILAATERRVRSYAGNDEALNRIAESLERDQAVFSAPMSASSLKQWVFSSWGPMRMRDPDGRARRRHPEARP